MGRPCRGRAAGRLRHRPERARSRCGGVDPTSPVAAEVRAAPRSRRALSAFRSTSRAVPKDVRTVPGLEGRRCWSELSLKRDTEAEAAAIPSPWPTRKPGPPTARPSPAAAAQRAGGRTRPGRGLRRRASARELRRLRVAQVGARGRNIRTPLAGSAAPARRLSMRPPTLFESGPNIGALAMTPDFHRIRRLPPYVFEEVNRLKARLRAEGVDIIDFGMGNPDMPTPKHIVDKLVETARDPKSGRYSASKGIVGLRRAMAGYYDRRFGVKLNPDTRGDRHPGLEGGLRQPRPGPDRAGRRHHLPQPGLSDPRLRLHHRRRRDPPCAGPVAGGISLRHQPRGAQFGPAAQRADRQLPVQPHRPVGRPGLLQGRHRPGQEARHAGAVRHRLFGNLLRRQPAARRSCRWKAPRTSPSRSIPSPRPTPWPAGGWAWWWATSACARRWRG